MLLKARRKKSKEFLKHLKFGFPDGFAFVCLFCCLETDLNKRLHVDRVFSGRGSLMEKGCLSDMSRNIKHARRASAQQSLCRGGKSAGQDRDLSVSALV